jgi:hypothetical protein
MDGNDLWTARKNCGVIMSVDLSSAELEIPTEYHSLLVTYLDAMYLRKKGDISGSIQLLQLFDQEAEKAGGEFKNRRNPVRELGSQE